MENDRAYVIFEDFGREALEILEKAGIRATVHPAGEPRPSREQMKRILEEYGTVVVGTGQKITPDMFAGIASARIIGTASAGVDHIRVPEEKKRLVNICNAPGANAGAVAEYTLAAALACRRRLAEGNGLYARGRDKKGLLRQPEELCGAVMGVVGAGRISLRVMRYAAFFGMRLLCHTAHPEKHMAETKSLGVTYVSLEELAEKSDVISVNLPNLPETGGIISAGLVERMKNTAVFISVSRIETVDWRALLRKAGTCAGFYLCMDLDPYAELAAAYRPADNILITPHIAGGTVGARKRMFLETAENIARLYRSRLGPAGTAEQRQ